MNRLDISQSEIEVFEHLKALHGADKVQPSYLRLEATLDNNNPNMAFELIDNASTRLECEKKLNVADAFVAVRTKMGIYERGSIVKDAALKLIETYPNQNAFTTDGTSAFDKTHLNLIYNADLHVERNGFVDVEAYATSEFYEASETQKTGGTNFSSSIGSDAGSVIITPKLTFKGSEETKISIIPKAYTGRKWANVLPLQNQVVLIFKGFIIKGAAKKEKII